MEKTLAKGLAALEALIRRDAPCGVSDLASELGISKSNAHRLLNTLLETGFVASENGRYKASLKTWELGTRVIRHFDVRDLARPAMMRLVRDTAEGVRLTVLDPERLEVVYIDKLDSPQDKPAALMRELERVRSEGYAVNNREYSPQVVGVAAPIFDREGNVVAASALRRRPNAWALPC
jgi:DNA-binding IclR family transcriptional regulator